MALSSSPNSAFSKVPTPLTSSSDASSVGNSPSIEVLGSQENGMCVVYPPHDRNSQIVLRLLREVNRLLQQRVVQKELTKWIQQNTDNSVRCIQGGRMEIFLQAENKLSTAFDTILGTRLSQSGAKQKILNYASEQARLDPRFSSSSSSSSCDMEFGNFSLICTPFFHNGSSSLLCDAQAPHIDLTKPNFQFGLVCSEGVSGTLFFSPEYHRHINTVDAVVDQWQQMAQALGPHYKHSVRMTPALVQALQQNETAKMLLDHFGDVLLPERYVLNHMNNKDNLPTGSLLSLPGSVIHAGPASMEFRAILFFSGWPKGSEAAPYDPDVQYTGVLLMGHLVSLLWRLEGIGYTERHFLLERLAQYVENSTTRKLFAHFRPGPLANFIGNIEDRTERKVSWKKDDYIHKMAQSLDLGLASPGDDPFAESETIEVSELQALSVHGLFTMWGGIEYAVEVYYRMSDDKVIMRYPIGDDSNVDEWEGNLADDKFELIMNDGTDELFDGTNGKLLDTDGNEIRIYKCSEENQ